MGIKPAVLHEMDCLPELPADAVAPWRKVDENCGSQAMMLAMRLRITGSTMREACERSGLSDTPIRVALARYHLTDIARRAGTDTMIDNHREIALETTHRQLEKLADGEVDPKLAIVGGISTDKVDKYEGWNQRGDTSENLGDRLGEIAERVVRAGGKLDIHIEGPTGKAHIEAGGE